MKKTTILFTALLLAATTTLSAQDTKGARATHHSSLIAHHSTRAVVIGISDYQDAAIPDLRFAHRDAEAFANFLRSPGGGAMSDENLRVLTNKNATAGQVIAALTWLLDESKPGDQAIIYFSGHGDVEAKLLNQLGFLLLWDSPAHVYLAGALPVDMLRQVVSTLSIKLKTRVFVVVDACRAGKLAGNTVIGTQLTNNQLAQQFSAEQKILSCQPNEFSIEGEQWGGGRGVFSYHLCNGLYGLADGDRNGQVSLFEIGRYLEDRVPREVSPLSQLPLTVGDKSGSLFSVDGPTLVALEREGAPPASISKIEQRGMLQEVLAKADSNIRFWYAGFERTLREKHFFEPEGDCAEHFYQKLYASESTTALRPMLNRNYAADLQDDAQQAINIWLAADVQQLACIGKSLKLEPIPRQLGRAAELLGEGHYMYRSLQARKLLFEGIAERQHSNPDEVLARQCLEIFRKSEALEPQSPLPWYRMSQTYADNLRMPDSAFVCARKARELAPNWVLPFVNLGYTLAQEYKLDLAKQALEEAEAIDSQHPLVINRWATWFFAQPGQANLEKALSMFEKYRGSGGPMYPCWHNDYGFLLMKLDRYAEAEQQYEEAIALDSTEIMPWNNLGDLFIRTRRYADAEQVLKKAIALDSTDRRPWNHLGDLYIRTRRFTEAEPVFKKAIALDSTHVFPWNGLGYAYLSTLRYAEAEPALKKAVTLDSTSAIPRKNLGTVYFKTNHPDEARQQFLKAIVLDPNHPVPTLCMAYLLTSEGKTAEAFAYVEQAIGKKATFEQLEKDEDLAPLRALPEWKALMKKYFPDQVKD